jgi:murein DD-endopeptidase MepM/ murein hydrolase activator NlpD
MMRFIRFLLAIGLFFFLGSCAIGVRKFPLQIPISNCTLEQKFGEYLGTYEGVVYEGYHTGVDLIVLPGTPIGAMATGRVIRTGLLFNKAQEGGWYIVIEHEALGIYTQYLHVAEPRVNVGAMVKQGEIIADLMDPTLFPAHLHIEVKPKDLPIRLPDGGVAYFANAKTSPKGNRGYVLSEVDLRRYWIDPMSLLQTWCKELP